MPQVIPLLVTAITTVTSAVVAAGPLAVAAFNAANIIGAAALANEAFKAVQPSVKSSSSAIEWNADPNAPNRFPFGRVGGAGNIIHNATYGPDKMYVGFVGVMGASGPIKSWVSLKADDAFVSFNGTGMAITSDYAGEMWIGRQRGLQPEPSYLASPSGLKHGAAMPRWGASYKLSGKAAYHYTLGENSKRSAYKGKVPTGIHTIEGLFCYDPRLDDTYPGGAGPCRIDDPTTWVYSINAYIHGLNWNIGRWEGLATGYTPARYGVPYASMKVGGIGARPDGIDFAAYVEAANVFDENAWACAAWPDADQGKGAVLDSFLQAGGGIYAERQGKMSCLHRAAPRASLVTITADDTAGTVEYDTTTSLLERINTIRPEYWSEAHGWQMVATDEVTSSVWREEDGQGVEVTKSKGMAYNYVPQSKQARELAALQIAHTREGIRGTAPLRHYLDLDVGDCFTFEVPEAILNGQKCIVLNVDPDLENDIINVTFASESDAKYPFAFGQADAPPPAPGLQPSSTFVSPPLPGDWTITPRPPAPGGGQLPGFDLSGVVSNDTATAIIVEYGLSATGPWKQAYQGPPTVTNIPIDGLQPGATYYVAIQYQRNQNYSAREVFGPYTAPLLDPSPSAPTIVGLQTQITTAFGDIFDVSELVADARADIDAQGAEIAAARNGEASLSARIATVNQARIDGDSANATAITNLTARTANTEADIIDIENAAAAETTARVQSVNQLLAMARDGSMNPNPIFSAWSGALPDDWTRHGTVGASTMTKVAGINGSPNALRQASNLTSECGLRTDVSPSAGGEYAVIEADFTLVSGSLVGAGILCQTLNSGGGSAGNTFSQAFATAKDASGTVRGAGVAGQTYRYRMLANLKAATAATYRLYGMTRYSPGAWGPADGAATLDWHRLAIRPATPEEIAAGTAIPALQASVTTNSLAIVDIENALAIASWQVVASAGGGKPARIGLTSSTLGSFVALDAPFIFWGDNTVFDDATDTLQTTVGGRIRVLALGTPFGAASDLLEWWGPSSIALGSMTKANGYNGRMTASPYVFDNALTPAPGTPTVNVTAPCSSNGTTNATAVSSTKTVPASPRVKASFGYSYDGGSIMSGVGSSTFVVEFFEQQGATINVLETTTMTVTGTPTSVSDVAGGSVSNFPTGKNGTLTGSVTYGIRHRRTSGSLNFTNLRCTLYAEIIGQT